MDRIIAGTCSELARELGIEQDCCTSCHWEWEDGYETHCEVEYKGRWYSVCCKMASKVQPSKELLDHWMSERAYSCSKSSDGVTPKGILDTVKSLEKVKPMELLVPTDGSMDGLLKSMEEARGKLVSHVFGVPVRASVECPTGMAVLVQEGQRPVVIKLSEGENNEPEHRGD